MSTLAFVFPGQGSQRAGMLESAPRVPNGDRLLEMASTLSGLDLARIAAEGPDAALADTRAAQPLLFIAGWRWATTLEAAGVTPALIAGHSLGEITALAFAGALPVESGLELVCARARIMAETAATTPGTMAAVLGMDRTDVAALLEGVSGVWVANDNGPGQVVLSGTHDGIERATQALSGAGARRIVPLAVAGPFHSPLMMAARDEFASVLARVEFLNARVPVLSNTLPEPTTDGGELRARLMDQMVSPVRWTETMRAFVAGGIDVVVETGPGAVLAGLARRVEGVTAVAVEGDGLERVLEVAGV